MPFMLVIPAVIVLFLLGGMWLEQVREEYPGEWKYYMLPMIFIIASACLVVWSVTAQVHRKIVISGPFKIESLGNKQVSVVGDNIVVITRLIAGAVVDESKCQLFEEAEKGRSLGLDFGDNVTYKVKCD